MRVFQKSVICAGLVLLESGLAEPTQKPIRSRFNASILEDLFHKGDQRMFQAFADLKVDDIPVQGYEAPEPQEAEEGEEVEKEELPEEVRLTSDISVSLAGPEGKNEEDYDFEFSLNNEEFGGYLGFQGKELRLRGEGKVKGSDDIFKFTAPVTAFKVEVELVPETQEEILKYNEFARMAKTLPFDFSIGEVTFTDFPENEHSEQVKGKMGEQLVKTFMQTYDDIWNGDMSKIANLPVESFIPLLFTTHLSRFAQELVLSPKAIDMGFDPEQLLAKSRSVSLIERKSKLFKEINSEFTSAEGEGDERAFQFIIDENAVNSFLLDFVLVDKSFSAREFASMSSEAAPYMSKLNTSTVGMLLPQIIEEFGEDRAIDVMFTTSHELISAKLPEAKVSGFQMDRNGNFRFAVNLGFEILVEKKGQHKQYEEARAIYIQLVAKGKIIIKEGKRKKDRSVILMAKAAEMGGAKIFSADGEEMVVEQMVLTSGVNVQLEQMVKMLTPFEMPIYNPPSPRELECLGMKLADMNLVFRKGYMELSFDYKKVGTPSDPEVCDKFMNMMRQGPESMINQAKEEIGGDGILEYLKKKKDGLEGEMEGRKAKIAQDKDDEKETIMQVDDL